jgi:hypothetical protein
VPGTIGRRCDITFWGETPNDGEWEGCTQSRDCHNKADCYELGADGLMWPLCAVHVQALIDAGTHTVIPGPFILVRAQRSTGVRAT